MKTLLMVVPLSLALMVTLALTGCQKPPAQPVASVAEKPTVSAVAIAPTDPAELTDPSVEIAVKQDAYVDFTQARYDELLLNGQPFALFFHATWCPTCWAVEADILENIGELPEGAVILKTDYDIYTELKAKYNVKSQSVIVMVDGSGELAKTLVAPSFNTLKNTFTDLLQ